jgi:hypothetical protein
MLHNSDFCVHFIGISSSYTKLKLKSEFSVLQPTHENSSPRGEVHVVQSIGRFQVLAAVVPNVRLNADTPYNLKQIWAVMLRFKIIIAYRVVQFLIAIYTDYF